jgi:hypothetical protein
MGSMSRLAGCLLAAWLLTLVGCQKLRDERTVTIDPPGGSHRITYSGPRSEQKVSVEVSSTGTPVDVYLVLAKDQAEAEKSIETRKPPANVLDRKEKTTEATLEGTIPAKEDFCVLIYATEAATVKVLTKSK